MKILVNIPDDLLEQVDAYCIKEERTRTQVVRLALKDYFAERKPNPPRHENGGDKPESSDENRWETEEMLSAKEVFKCEVPGCRVMGKGKYRVFVPDNIDGQIVSEKYLCAMHVAKAQKEGEVEKV